MPQCADHPAQLASFGLHIVARLGSGQEADVYRVRDSLGRERVAKLFGEVSRAVLNHGGIVGRRRHPIGPTAGHLRRLSRQLRHPVAGLNPVHLLEHDGQLLGLTYRFEPLAQLRRPLLRSPHVRRAYFAAFAAMQAWLLRHAALASVEPQFLIAHDGTLRFIEYGPMLLSPHDIRCREDHYLSQTVLRLLAALYRPRDTSPASWPHLRPAVSADAPEVAALLDALFAAPESAFAGPAAYAALARASRDRIPLPLVLLARLAHQPRDTRKH